MSPSNEQSEQRGLPENVRNNLLASISSYMDELVLTKPTIDALEDLDLPRPGEDMGSIAGQDAEGAEQRDVHQGGDDPPDTEAAGEGRVNLTKQALRVTYG